MPMPAFRSEGQAVIWHLLDCGNPKSTTQLAADAGVAPQNALRVLQQWEADGLVVRDAARKRRVSMWCRAAPEVSTAAADLGPAARMWRVLRSMRSATPRDIAAFASRTDGEIAERDAARFCAVLLMAGYVRVMRKAMPGVRPACYRLIRDTGPNPPEVRRVLAVWDPNEGAYSHVPEPAS